jgi:hypothetical protein
LAASTPPLSTRTYLLLLSVLLPLTAAWIARSIDGCGEKEGRRGVGRGHDREEEGRPEVLLSPSLGGNKGGEDTSSGIASEEGSGKEDIGIERQKRDAGGAGDFVAEVPWEVRRNPKGGEGGRERGRGRGVFGAGQGGGAGGIGSAIGGVLSTTQV